MMAVTTVSSGGLINIPENLDDMPAEELVTAKEMLGALEWYRDNCNDMNLDGRLSIERVAKKLKLTSVDERLDDEDYANGSNTAWLFGCDRLRDKIKTKGYEKYLTEEEE